LFLASKEASSVKEIGSELAENSHSELVVQHFLAEFHELKVVVNNLDIGMYRNRCLTVSNAPNSNRIGIGVLLAVYSTRVWTTFACDRKSGAGDLCVFGAGLPEPVYLVQKSLISPQNTGIDQSYLFSAEGVKTLVFGAGTPKLPRYMGRELKYIRTAI
jgi:hypothetical protein